jgi:hypothetical protein
VRAAAAVFGGEDDGARSGNRVPDSTRDKSVVPAPTRLLKIETPDGAPEESRRISKIENGRRSRGSCPPDVLIITNWPGSADAAISGAAREITL